MFRHLFGVGADEVYDWDLNRYQRHKQYAEQWLKQPRGLM